MTPVWSRVAVLFSRGQVPPNALEGLKLGRITALEKPDGGVRGIVVGVVFRRIVARTIAQQIGDQVEKATAPYQFALKTRAGCECEPHTPHIGRDGRSHDDPVS